MIMTLPTMSSSTKILLGLLSGVFVGIFLGEYASVLKVVADGFVKLLQMTVLPYITLSIVTSLGRLSFDQVKTLGLRAGAVLIGLWCLGIEAFGKRAGELARLVLSGTDIKTLPFEISSDIPMFKPFFTTKKDGMGMGLSIARTIGARAGASTR